MKIIIKKTIIENAIVRLQPFLERKDFSHITSHILFEVSEEDGFILKATDNELGLKIEITDFILDESGIATCNGKKILDTIRTLKDGDVIMETNEENNTMHIKQNRSNYKLPMFKADEFPVFPQFDNLLKINIDSLKIINSFKKIMPTIDHTNPKIELNGALIDIKENIINIVRTDTKRLGIIKIDNNSTDEIQIIIPKKAIIEIQKLFIDQIEIYYDETNLIIVNNNYFFFTRLINGNYPDYQRIIPKDIKYSILLPKKEMTNSIKMITAISQEIKITFNKNSIIFNSLAPDNIQAKTELIISTPLENFELNVNSRYLLDFISQVEDNEFEILLNEPTLPFVLKEKQFITVIMPIIV